MRKFEDNRIKKSNIVSSLMQQPIPIACVEPKELNDDSVVFLFNGGLNATNDGNLYMNNAFYDKHYFITYEKASHGNNQNKASQFKKKWLIELDVVVDWIRQTYPNRRIYLLGESWGSSISLLYYLQHKNKVFGAAFWNMPTKPIDPDSDKKTIKEKWSTAIRQLAAIVFNKPVKLKSTNKDYGTISRDPLLVRAMNVATEGRQNALLTAAVWRYMGPSRRKLFKYGKNPEYNFMYIQSGQDAMADKKMLPKYQSKLDSAHYTFLPTGYHILAFEPIESIDLYRIIETFIKK